MVDTLIIMLAFGSLIYLQYRISSVFQKTGKWLFLVGQESRMDAVNNKPWRWRFDYLDEIKEGNMIIKFWKPLDSFAPDKKFIQPSKK